MVMNLDIFAQQLARAGAQPSPSFSIPSVGQMMTPQPGVVGGPQLGGSLLGPAAQLPAQGQGQGQQQGQGRVSPAQRFGQAMSALEPLQQPQQQLQQPGVVAPSPGQNFSPNPQLMQLLMQSLMGQGQPPTTPLAQLMQGR